MNNSSQSKGGGLLTGLIITVVLILIGLAIYAGYTKLWVPKQCVGQAATSNVATFKWDSNVCTANTCTVGYGTGSTATKAGDPPCTQYVAPTSQYKLFSNTISSFDGNCGGTTPVSVSTGIKVQMDCETACNTVSGCVGYDWDGSGCNTYSTPLVAPTSETKYKCYQKPTTVSKYQMY